MVPNVLLMFVPFAPGEKPALTRPRFTWFATLNDSARNCNLAFSRISQFLTTDRSTLITPDSARPAVPGPGSPTYREEGWPRPRGLTTAQPLGCLSSRS